jgi:uncharacterized protein YeaO (DUF488 family)
MAIRVVRLGAPRSPGEGPRLGTVRRPPRGVPRSEFGRRDFYDVWLPELAPGAPLVSWAMSDPWTSARWRRFERAYLKEMSAPAARHLIATLATLSATTSFAVGCYCEDASRCHRVLLARLLADAGATVEMAE